MKMHALKYPLKEKKTKLLQNKLIPEREKIVHLHG
jgi:hypothetical protein